MPSTPGMESGGYIEVDVDEDLEGEPASDRTAPLNVPTHLVRGPTTAKQIVVAARATNDRYTLTVVNGLAAGQVFTVPTTGCTLGRSQEVEVFVDDQAVSRRHARIVRTTDAAMLEDLGSTNGTFVEGTRVNRVELRSGNRIQLGATVLRFSVIDGMEEALQRRLYESSTRDPLTSTFNRAYLGERLLAETASARRHGTPLSLVMLDLDNFKAVNDTYGHLAGDRVLAAIAAVILNVVRVEDVVARYGGEEFVVLLRATELDGAKMLADRLRQAVADERIPIDGHELSVTASVGVAAISELAPGQGLMEVLGLADARLYTAKATGRNRVCAAGPGESRSDTEQSRRTHPE